MVVNGTNKLVEDTINKFLVPQEIAKIATQEGYNIEAQYLPQEFQDLLKKVTEVVLAKVKETLYSQGLNSITYESTLKKIAPRLIEAKLRQVCRLLPEDLDFPEANSGLWDWVSSFFRERK